MAVLINFKICDNAKECGGVCVCPTGALSWNDEKGTIEIDNSKCVACGLCQRECPIGAISVARTQEEYDKIKRQIDDDERTTKDLFVDRYGAVIVSDFFRINVEDIPNKTNKPCYVLVELFNPDEAECLSKSIPIKELTRDLPEDTLFYKAECAAPVTEYGIERLPSLMVFKDGNLLGAIDGYYSNAERDVLTSFISKTCS